MEGDARKAAGESADPSRAPTNCRLFEPDHEVNPARSPFMQPKHAQDKPCGLRQRFRLAFGVGRVSVCQKPFVPPRADLEAIISVNSKTLLPNSSLLTPNSSLYQPPAPNH